MSLKSFHCNNIQKQASQTSGNKTRKMIVAHLYKHIISISNSKSYCFPGTSYSTQKKTHLKTIVLNACASVTKKWCHSLRRKSPFIRTLILLTNGTTYCIQDKCYKSTISDNQQRFRVHYPDTEKTISNFHDNTPCRVQLYLLIRPGQVMICFQSGLLFRESSL